MKFRNNLSDEAFRNLYREQGYNEKQITELIDGSLDDIGLEHDYKSHCTNAHGADLYYE